MLHAGEAHSPPKGCVVTLRTWAASTPDPHEALGSVTPNYSLGCAAPV